MVGLYFVEIDLLLFVAAKAINKARKEAELKGESFEQPKSRRIAYIEQLDVMNWQRYLDEHEAVQRDKVK